MSALPLDRANNSPAELIASLNDSDRRALLSQFDDDASFELQYEWERFWARPKQLPPPGNWRVWLVLAGRGFGKTRTGGEWVRAQIERGLCKRLALVAPTAADARDVMIEGESGLLAISSPRFRPTYEPSKRRVTWPNGAIATLYSADEPERLRGPQHDGAWTDEIAAWRYPQATWDMLMFGLRLGRDPRVVVTTTPKPIPLVKSLVASPTTATTRGATYENYANLAQPFIDTVIKPYEGTRLGRQELMAEILEDVEGALWHRDLIERSRVLKAPELIRVAIAVDPPGSSNGGEAGIVAGGISREKHGYLLDDRSLRGSPQQWASAAVTAYHTYGADVLVAERNYGGEMVEQTIRGVDRSVNVKVVTATRGKTARAEPVVSLYERQQVHHVGAFPGLEDQLCEWVPGDPSPDRLDANVWLWSELLVQEPEPKREIQVY